VHATSDIDLATWVFQTIREAYRDPDGRYVLVVEPESGPPCWSLAEWPASLQVVSTWTDKSVLAADNPDAGAVTLLA
jgi:beta-galactosidase GanA